MIAASVIAAIASGATFTCTPTRVWDGDGPVWCAEGPKIRLAGIAAREMDGSCRPNHPCPKMSPAGSRDHLAALLMGRTYSGKLERASTGHVLVTWPVLRCTPDGSAGRGRVAAWCVSPAVGDLSCAMVRSGHALKWPKFWRGHRCSVISYLRTRSRSAG